MQLGKAVVARIEICIQAAQHDANLRKRHVAVLVRVEIDNFAHLFHNFVQRHKGGGQLFVVVRLGRPGVRLWLFGFFCLLCVLGGGLCLFHLLFGRAGGLLFRGLGLFGLLGLFGPGLLGGVLFQAHQHVQIFERVARCLKGRGRFAFAHANDKHAAFAQAGGQACEVGIGADQAEAVHIARI